MIYASIIVSFVKDIKRVHAIALQIVVDDCMPTAADQFG